MVAPGDGRFLMSEVTLYRRWCVGWVVARVGFGRPCILPHGGLRTFHQKSTCLRAINFRAVWRATLEPSQFGGPESFEVHPVER